MKLKYYLRLVAIMVVLFLGCTSNLPYRTYIQIDSDKDYARETDNPHAAERSVIPGMCTIETNSFTNSAGLSNSFKIGSVEFDDQGWFWSHRQWESVRRAITNEIFADTNQGVTVVVFVHGWQNNAASDTSNVKTFRKVLTNLTAEIAPRRKVFGVYVGWRGKSISPFGLKEFSFYHRKDVAERIGHQGATMQVFTELQLIQDMVNSPLETNTNNSSKQVSDRRMALIVIGHSFGAQLAYAAIEQVLTERLLMSTFYKEKGKDQQPVRSFGDLVILLSPAFEASLFNNLISLATSSELTYSPKQRPILAIFTSKGDSPNSFWFPFGRRFATLVEACRPSTGKKERYLFNQTKEQTADQRRAINHTVGFDKDYITYDLDFANEVPLYVTNTSGKKKEITLTPVLPIDAAIRANYAILAARELTNGNAPQTFPSKLLSNSLPLPVASNSLFSYVFTNVAFEKGKKGTNVYVLRPRLDSRYFNQLANAGNPFINVQMSTKIMRGHDDLDNTNLIQFLQDFIEFAGDANLLPTNKPASINPYQ